MTSTGNDAVPEKTPDPRVARGGAVYRRALLASFCAALAVFAQMYSPQGLLPDIARDLGIDAEAAAWTVGITTTGVAIAVLPWARLSDRLGRIAAMRIALGSAVALGLIAPFAPNLETLIVLRFLTGIALAGLPGIAITALAETVRPRDLGTAVGVFVSGNALGGLVGRVAAGIFGEVFGWRGGMLAVAALAMISGSVFLLLIPRTRIPPHRGLPVPTAALANLRNPGVRVLLLQGFLLMGGFTVVYNFLAFHLEAPPFELDLAQISWFFLSYLAAVVASPAAWRLAARARPTTVLLGSTIVVLLSLGLLLVPSVPIIAVGVVIFTGAFFGAHGIANGLVGLRAAGTPAASQAPALYTLSFYIGTSVFSWLGGVVFTSTGWNGSIALCAGLLLVVAALAGFDRHRDR